ncbi:MAG: 1-phosphofructokinase [Anaerolineae bacterium]
MSPDVRIATVTLNPAIDQTVSIPGFRTGQVNRVAHTRSDPGGKGVNVASVLADFGHPVSVTGFLGEENTQLFERLFAQKKIDDRFVRIAGNTRTGIKIIDETKQETTDINFPGETPTAQDVQALVAIVKALTSTCDWFVLSGSIPAGLSPDIYQHLVTVIKAEERSVALDTSGEGLHLAIASGPTLIKPNIDELQELSGRTLESEQAIVRAAQALLGLGVECIVVSMGKQGAIFVEGDQVIVSRPPGVTVKSTVGAGDAMVSGMVAGKVQGSSLTECARLATAFSVDAITHVGSGLPSMASLRGFMDQVIVEKLS